MDCRQLICEARGDKGYFRLKVLGLDIGLMWKCADWNWGFQIAFWGHGFCFEKGFWLIHECYDEFWGFAK